MSQSPAPESTPLIAQYLALKAQNADCMLFFRVGDFYELFFEDAVLASRAIGLTLTKRGKHLGEDIPLAGVPVVSVQEYLSRLIEAGFRVAIAEQTETAEDAKKRGYKAIVSRDITRIVTAGTLTEERLLMPNKPSRLCALGFNIDTQMCALVCADISTGELNVRIVPIAQILESLVALQPAELLMPDRMGNIAEYNFAEIEAYCKSRNVQIAHYPATMLHEEAARKRIEAYFNIVDFAVFGVADSASLIALASVLYYIERTQKGLNVPLNAPKQAESSQFLLMDAATRANLELTETLSGQITGTVLSILDETKTGAGARLLRDFVNQPIVDLPQIHARQSAVQFGVNHQKWRDEIRDLLKSFPDIARSLTRLTLNRGGPRDLVAISNALEIAKKIEWLFTKVAFQESELLSQIQGAFNVMPVELIDVLASALNDSPPMSVNDGNFVREGYNEQLDFTRNLRDTSHSILLEMEHNLKAETNIRSLKICHNNVLGYYIEVSTQFGEVLRTDAEKRFILRQSLPNATRFTTSQLSEIESKISSAAVEAFAQERIIFENLRQIVLEETDELKNLCDALALLDVVLSLAHVAVSNVWARPKVDESLAFDIEDGRHFVVEAALKQQNAAPFIANSIDLSAIKNDENGQIALVTGPNMGGKSTFLRQNALIALLAHIGSFVPAKAAHIGLVDRIFSRVGASDDLAKGGSTFMVEMVETASILNQATPKSFVILDEIGRGTATWDGLSIAWASLEHLHSVSGCRTIFATHFHELTELKTSLQRLQNLNVAVKEWNGQLIFLHAIQAGVADRSYGIHVAQKAGLPRAVIQRATTLLKKLEKGIDRKKPSELLAELPLFAALEIEPEVQKLEAWQQEILAEVQALNPDEMNPKAALEFVYKLKEIEKHKI